VRGFRRRARHGLGPALLAAGAALGAAAAEPGLPQGPPAAGLDLTRAEDVRLVRGQWRHAEARIVETWHRAPGADGQPTGAPVVTHGIAPRAGGADFDDSGWERVEPEALSARRGSGRLSFHWYRTAVTIPERIGVFDPTGSTVVLEVAIDDYAEVWVDGELARGLGQRGGSVVAGWNAPNRLVIGRAVKPGRRIQLAVFGANGPLSDPPANFIWVRSARLDFHAGEPAGPFAIPPREVNLEVLRLDPALDAIVPPNPKLHKLAEGFEFTEGPLWVRDPGHLLFSDPNANRIYRYDPAGDGALSVFREKSGYDGPDLAEYGQPGSNGLTLDREGRLVIAEHGRHRVTRLERDGSLAVLADRHRGKRLNSPNDLVFRSDGTLFFSDPPFGLPRQFADPRRELDFSGVFAWREGEELRLASRDLEGPNGLALSPDERFLYATNWDPRRKVVMRYQVAADGSLSDGRVFFDMTGAPGEEALDGVKLDRRGNLYVSGPGGLWILSPEAVHLGTLRGPRLPANLAWGDEDGKSLYLTARSALYRIRLGIEGIRP
jgi:gluconolactonase